MIEELTTQTVLATNLANVGSYELEFANTMQFITPKKLVYKISAKTLSDEVISEKFTIHFYDLIFYGLSLSDQNIDESYKENKKITSNEIEIVCKETTGSYKFFALPERYEIDNIIDKKTSLQFVVSEDVKKTTIENDFGLSVNYNLFFSVYPIESEVTLKVTLKDKK